MHKIFFAHATTTFSLKNENAEKNKNKFFRILFSVKKNSNFYFDTLLRAVDPCNWETNSRRGTIASKINVTP